MSAAVERHLSPLHATGALAPHLLDRYAPMPFLVDLEGDVVRLSSGKPGYPAGDFGKGRITWRESS